jgi:hypothetical protein
MKILKIKTLTVLYLALMLFSCTKETTTTQAPATTGSATFFAKSDLGAGNITVSVNGQVVGTISHYYPSGVTCGSSDVNIEEPAGTYSWTAVGANGSPAWSNTVTITNGACVPIELTNNGGSSGGGGTGNGGGNSGGITSSTISYLNNSFKNVTITVNNQTKTIAPGNTVAFTGTPGSLATGTASSSGQTSSGTQVGLKITWALSNTFPASGALSVPLNVGSNFFFLRIINNSAYTINSLYVNYGLQAQSQDNISIPDDGNTYDIGYYSAYSNSNVRAESGSLYWLWSSLNLPYTQNQSTTVTAN